MTIDKPSSVHRHGLRLLWQEAFGDPEQSIDAFFETAFSPERCRCVFRWETVAAALYWLDCSCNGKKIAYIYAVAVGKEFRGQGLCKALMEDTHRHLLQAGYELAVLVPSDVGLRQMYGKLGYENFGGMDCIHAVAGEKIPLRPLDAVEYGTLRKSLLPEGGILQEGVTLEYLGKFAQFYAGEDFLACCAIENGKLRCLELLGNTQKASGIVAAHGAQEGTFRIPGKSPFAMCLPLKQRLVCPGYFGLALD